MRTQLTPSRSIVLIPGVFEISRVHNTGAAFGLMAGQRLLFIAVTAVVLAGIAWVWMTYRPTGRLVVMALGLVTGGALGNLVDRVAVGRVTDFLNVHPWPVFNVADSAVVVGVTILVVWLLFRPDDEDEQASAPSASDSG